MHTHCIVQWFEYIVVNSPAGVTHVDGPIDVISTTVQYTSFANHLSGVYSIYCITQKSGKAYHVDPWQHQIFIDNQIKNLYIIGFGSG